MNASVVVIVPIYKETLDTYEQFSLDMSLSALSGRAVCFIGPGSLDRRYYTERYPQVPYQALPDHCLSSIAEYNRLLLTPGFYQIYSTFEFILILQTDAIVLRDELDHWCALHYDYIGAPWPTGIEINLNVGALSCLNGKSLRTFVGNGGLSLRRINACLSVMQELPELLDYFRHTASNEDLFFSLAGHLSKSFAIPDEIVASTFALEVWPSYYLAINGGRVPMGGHGWWKYQPEIWQIWLPTLPQPEKAA